MDIQKLSAFEQEHLLWDRLIFLYAIISLIIGACIMRIIDFVSFSYSTIAYRKNFHYWAHFSGLFMIFITLLFYWFNIFDWPVFWKQQTSQFFLIYISSLIYPVLIYTAIVVLTPKFTPRLNIRKHFFNNRRAFFGLLSLASLYLTFHDLVFLKQEFKIQKHLIRVAGGMLFLILACFNENKFKKHFVWLYLSLIAIHVVYFFMSKK